MEGYYTALFNDVTVDSHAWRWVRIDPSTVSGVELAGVQIADPERVYMMLQHAVEPVALTDLVERAS